MNPIDERLSKIRKSIDKADVLVVFSGPARRSQINLGYVSGFFTSRGENSPSVAIIPREGNPVLLTAEFEKAKAASWIRDVRPCSSPLDRHKPLESEEKTSDPIVMMKQVLDELGLTDKKIGVEGVTLPVNWYHRLQAKFPHAKLVDCSLLLETLRMIKDQEELKWIRAAVELCDEGTRSSIEAIKSGVSEIEIDSFGDATVDSLVSERHPGVPVDRSFAKTVSGARSADPSGDSTPRKIQREDIVVHSRIISLNHYYGETERTVIFGPPSEKQAKLFQAMLNAQARAIESIKPGVRAQDVDRIARRVIEEAGYAQFIRHRTGHSIGLDGHEWNPSLLEGVEIRLEKGMVVTVEPGLYVAGFGGVRHSDAVLVTEGGHEVLSKIPRDLQSLTLGA